MLPCVSILAYHRHPPNAALLQRDTFEYWRAMLGIMRASTFALVFYYLLGHSMPGYIDTKDCPSGFGNGFSHSTGEGNSAAFAKQQNLWKEHQANLQRRAHEHIRKGYEMDPGGRRFHIVEQTYFERAANIHTEDVEAQLSYGVLLLEVRRNTTKALFYLRRARSLVESVRLRPRGCYAGSSQEELRAPDQSRRKWMELRTKAGGRS